MPELPKSNQSFYRLVVLCSLLVAVLWVALVPTQPYSDFDFYHRTATEIAAGGSWGDTYTAIGYSVFLAGFYWLFGSHFLVAKLVNLMLFLLCNLLAARLLPSVRMPEGLRRAAFLVFAFFPVHIYYTSIISGELLFSALLLLDLLVYSSNLRAKYVWMGLITGVGSMVKPFFPAFLLVILLTELLSRRRLRLILRDGLVMSIVIAAVIAPWLYRNYRLIGEFTWISNNGGIVLYINNNSQNTDGRWMPAEDVADSLVTTPGYQAANATERNHLLSQAAKQWIKAHPKEFVVLGCKRLLRTFLLPNDIDYSLHGTGASDATYLRLCVAVEMIKLPVYLFGILSVVAASLRFLRRRFLRGRQDEEDELTLVELSWAITFFMFAGVYFITEGQSRYAFPTIFILVYFSCRALAAQFRPSGRKVTATSTDLARR